MQKRKGDEDLGSKFLAFAAPEGPLEEAILVPQRAYWS